MSNIFIICGPSGVGKGTIIKKILFDKELKIETIPTITTRKPSPRDKLTKNYKFLSKDDFFDKSKKGEFIETNYYDNNYYATSKKDIEQILNSNKIAIKEQDITTAIKTKKQIPNKIKIIFITSSLETIKNRLIKRKENTQKEIERRISQAKKELTLKDNADFIVENPENFPETAVKEIKNIIKGEI